MATEIKMIINETRKEAVETTVSVEELRKMSKRLHFTISLNGGMTASKGEKTFRVFGLLPEVKEEWENIYWGLVLDAASSGDPDTDHLMAEYQRIRGLETI